MKTAVLLTTIAALSATTAAAAQKAAIPKTPPGSADIRRVAAGTYRVDPNHSQVTFAVSHLGFSTYRGLFGGLTGTMMIDPRAPARARIDIVIPIRGLVTTVKALDQHLMAPGFFDATRFPTARFVSTAIRPSGKTARISGNLTLKGVTRPVVLEARFVGAGVMMGTRTIGFDATTTIRRSAFGIREAVPLIPDAVPLDIAVAFEKPAR